MNSRMLPLMLSVSALVLSLTVISCGKAKAADQATADTTKTAASQPNQARKASDVTLEEVVVTAQQRGENVQKAAIPIDVVTGAGLLNSGIRGIDTLSNVVPALAVPASGQGNFIFIRGVGNFSFTPNSDPAAAYNYDGVYVGRSSATFGTFFDLERVEVLKGPQGTLYGRNATSGAINILPVQPHMGETSGYGTLSFGNYNAVSADAAVNFGIGSSTAVRISGTYSSHDGYLNDGTQADNSAGVRAQVKSELTSNLTIRIEGSYAQLDGTNVVGGATYIDSYALNPATGQFSITASGLPLGEGMFTSAEQSYRSTIGTTSSIPTRKLDQLIYRPFIDNSVYGIAGHIDWQTEIGTFSLVPAWRHARKENLNTDSGQAVGDYQDADQNSIEGRLVSNSGGLFDYNLGAFYITEQVNDDTHTGAGIQNAYTVSTYKTNSPAFYGRLTLHATDWLRFTAGARYTEDHKNFSSLAQVLSLACTVPTACPTAPLLPYTTTLAQQTLYPAASGGRVTVVPGVLIGRTDTAASGRLDTSKVTDRAAVEIDASQNSMLYASVETGYRAGGFNNFFNFAPENITAYTIGAKNRFFSNRLQLNAELFDWKYRGQQLSYLGVDPTGRVGVITQNIGRSTIKGLEVDGQLLVTESTMFNANVQYLDAKYDSFTYQSPSRPFTGCAVTATNVFTVDCSGKQALNSPKFTANFGIEQLIPVGSDQIVLEADAQYRSSRYVGFEYIAPEFVNSSVVGNASISYEINDGKYVIGAFVRNIGDKLFPIYSTPIPGSNLIGAIPSPGRTYGVRASAKF